MRRLAPIVLAGTLLLAACGGDGASPEAAADSIVLPAKEPAALPTDAPATTEPAGSTSATGATAATNDQPLATPLELDPCLVGTWNVSQETIGLLVAAAVLPVPDLTVPRGGFTVTIDADGTVVGDADFTGAFALGAQPAEADVKWTGSGTWGTLDGVVTLDLDQQEGGLVEVRLDGIVQPASALAVDIPIAGGTYTCSDAALEVTGSAGDTTVPLLFER